MLCPNKSIEVLGNWTEPYNAGTCRFRVGSEALMSRIIEQVESAGIGLFIIWKQNHLPIAPSYVYNTNTKSVVGTCFATHEVRPIGNQPHGGRSVK